MTPFQNTLDRADALIQKALITLEPPKTDGFPPEKLHALELQVDLLTIQQKLRRLRRQQ
jgi:hypothetical protein